MTAAGDNPAPLFAVLYSDQVAMKCLQAVRLYGPVGAYVAAGFVRNRFWDQLYTGRNALPDADIDVIYFDAHDCSRLTEQAFETALKKVMPDQCWQVRNQARMHKRAGHEPFNSVEHALMHWPETATAVGVRLKADGTLEHIAPFGLDDLYGHVLRAPPIIKAANPSVFEQRLKAKGWCGRWPNVQIVRS